MADYEPNQPYHSNVNTGGRAILPALSFEGHDQKNMIIFDHGIPFDLPTEKYGDPQFLAELSRCQPLVLEHVIITWQYYQKTHAQDVLPFLFLGPMAVARDPTFVTSNGITMLLAVRDGKAAAINPKIMDPARFPSAQNVESVTFDVLNEFDFVQRGHSAIKIINDHLKARTNKRNITHLNDVGGRVLVFCEAGDKRSALLVVLFMMVVFGLNAREAIRAVQARRYGISINGDLQRAAQTYEDIMKAERQVATASFNTNATDSSNRCAKRGFDQTSEEIEEMEMYSDENETSRTGTAPFKEKFI